MIILAIDPGFDKLGYAFFKFNKYPDKTYKFLSSGLIKSKSTDKIEQRLYFIYKNLSSLIDKIHPNLIVMEQIFF
jgi:Holliday junction resolvasome, endonuclease subunit